MSVFSGGLNSGSSKDKATMSTIKYNNTANNFNPQASWPVLKSKAVSGQSCSSRTDFTVPFRPSTSPTGLATLRFMTVIHGNHIQG